MSDKIIRGLKDVGEVCKSIGLKCRIVRLDDLHDKGYTGVKLILGYKMNPAYDPNAEVGQPNSNPRAADVRIEWMEPGLTVNRLAERLMKIKKSLETKVPIIDKSISTLTKPGKSDAELAAEVASGQFQNDFGEEDESDEIDVSIDEPYFPEEDHEVKELDSSNEILEALAVMNENITVLAGDIKSVSNNLKEVDGRLKSVEKKKKKKI